MSPGLEVTLNVAAVLSDDRLHGVEAKARSLTNALRREKGIEDVALDLGGNPRTVIADFDHDLVIVTESSEP